MVSLITVIAIFNFGVFPLDSVMAKTNNHSVAEKPASEPKDRIESEDQSKTTNPIKSTNQNKVKVQNKVKDQNKSTDQSKIQKFAVDKPLKSDSATEIANNLPIYLKDWMKYLKKGDCEKKCTLTYDDVLKLIEDEKITGQQAAVLGAIATQLNDENSTKETFTLKQLQKLFSPNNAIYYSYYYTAILNINGVRALSGPKEKLFGPTGALSSSTQIVQNQLGDCFILSAINGLLNTPGGPEKLQKMITRVPGKADEFLVKLPGDPKTMHIKLTQSKLAMYSNLTQGGEWLAVLSDAESRARRDNPESGIFNGGFQTQTLHLLTGKPYENKVLSPFTRKQVDTVKGLTKEQWSALIQLSSAQLAELTTLTPQQLESTLTKDQLKAFEELTSAQLAELQKINAAQWNELGTLVTNNKNNIDLKLLKTLQPLTQKQITEKAETYIDTALNKDKPPEIVGIETNDHDLTIIAYDRKTGTVTIKNPWGDTGWYNPVTAGGPDTKEPKNATTPPWFDMSKGVFQVQLTQLVESNFITITVPKSLVAAVKETKDKTSDKQTTDQAQSGVDQNNAVIDQAKASLDQANTNMSQAEKEKLKSEIDHAKAAVDREKALIVEVNQAEIAASQNGCQTSAAAQAKCQSKVQHLLSDLTQAESAAKDAADKVTTAVKHLDQ